jgi:3-isopropylmalate/(R)-2-methylmalate dehydratase small subunit
MQPFISLKSIPIPLPLANIDTDQIISAQYLKVTDKSGLAEGLFAGWCFKDDGSLNTEFPLNQEKYKGAEILLVGDNFGCGSSREHAPWALLGWGIRAVISTSFADIFRNNALKNGLLPVEVEKGTYLRLLEFSDQDSSKAILLDLPTQSITLPDGSTHSFPIDAFNKNCLLNGIDQLGYLIQHETQITDYEKRNAQV